VSAYAEAHSKRHERGSTAWEKQTKNKNGEEVKMRKTRALDGKAWAEESCRSPETAQGHLEETTREKR